VCPAVPLVFSSALPYLHPLHTPRPSYSPSGIYHINHMMVYCDMENHGGGWMLVLAYNHKAGDAFPAVPGTIPTNATHGYSHMSKGQLHRFQSFTSIRFFCTSSAHARVLHFANSNPTVIRAVKGLDGTNVAGLWTSPAARYLWFVPEHTGLLPYSTYVLGAGVLIA
jgi:hypothetical protein